MRVDFLIIFLFLLTPCWAQRWAPELNKQLRTARVVSVESLESAVKDWDGSNEYYLLTLQGGLKGVFRSEDEPWGSRAEVAAYRVDQELGTELVPPTVDRTLSRSELGKAWPWPELTERPGSLQLFVEGARPATKEDKKQPDLANSEILCFVLGRYDNHDGNLLVDPSGRLVLVDFEGALDHQMVRYGEFAFTRRGGYFHSPDGVPGDQPFPFDSPRLLVNPSLEEVERTFAPWWGQYWPQGMKLLHRLLNGIPDRTIPYVIWDDRLWVQVRVRSRHPAYTKAIPEDTLDALKQLTPERFDELLREPFTARHSREMMDRVEQLLDGLKAVDTSRSRVGRGSHTCSAGSRRPSYLVARDNTDDARY